MICLAIEVLIRAAGEKNWSSFWLFLSLANLGSVWRIFLAPKGYPKEFFHVRLRNIEDWLRVY